MGGRPFGASVTRQGDKGTIDPRLPATLAGFTKGLLRSS